MINFPDGAESESSQKTVELFKDTKPFPDLRAAGRELAARLETYRERDGLIVIGIILGGVPVADEVANISAHHLICLIIRRLPRAAGSGLTILRGQPRRLIADSTRN